MDQPQHVIQSPFNYYEWKYEDIILLKSKCLYRIATRIETGPNSTVEKEKWFSEMDEAFELLCFSISPGLIYHINTEEYANEVWIGLEGLFRQHYEIRGNQLENELNNLSQRTIQYFSINLNHVLPSKVRDDAPIQTNHLFQGDDALIQINHSCEGELAIDRFIIDEYLIVVSSITSSKIIDLDEEVIDIDEQGIIIFLHNIGELDAYLFLEMMHLFKSIIQLREKLL